ncbi:DUF6049 family protein [Frankia sp. Ag45/Mut15]|uniref:DUF6049 family protein n=1 Tax=Frankia umida TaxID=573489 RepID=A0ABT0JU11_9ACTN|nr:DUF6049 family protein [Frankia umida]MCK9875026.1 DUF6049 family protein [Frankia umida]
MTRGTTAPSPGPEPSGDGRAPGASQARWTADASRVRWAGRGRAGHRLVLALAVLVLVVLVELLPGSAATADPTRPTGGTDSSTGISGLSTPSSTGRSGSSTSAVPIATTITSSSSSDPAGPITVTITEVTQPVAGGSTVAVSGTLSTSSTETISDLWMSISLSTAVQSRGQLATLAGDARAAAGHSRYEKLRLPNGETAQSLTDPPVRGASPVPFQITGDLGTTAATNIGVYPLQIRVSSLVGARTVTAAAYSFVVRSRPTAVRTPVAVVLPIADRPRLRSDGLLTDNQLATDVSPTGRLSRLLDAATAHPPVTLAVDPTLVQELVLMSRSQGYAYASPGSTSGVTARTNGDASYFLRRLADYAAAGGSVIALPYGDADLAALVHARKLDIVNYAVKTGETVVAELVSRQPQAAGAVTYPANGQADSQTVDVLGQLKAGTVLLDDREFPLVAGRRYTPAAAVTVTTSAGPVRALRADHTLTALAGAYTASTVDPTAGAQLARFAAELGMISAENPTPRPQVLILPRDWNAPGTWAEQVLGAVTSAATAPTTLDDPAFTPTAQAVLPVSRLVYSADARSAELPASYLDSVSTVWSQAQALGPVLCAPPRATSTCVEREINPMTNALVTASSVWWRGAGRVDGVSLSQQVDGDVSAIRNGIRVVASRSVNLTSRHGLVPLTLENTTQREVTVVLMFSSTNRARLRSPVRQVRVLPPGQKAQIEFEVDAEGAGTFLLEIDRRNLDGQRLSTEPPTRVLVRSTVYGAIATGITFVAIGLLGLAVLLRFARRLRPSARRHRPDPTPDASLPPHDPYDPVDSPPPADQYQPADQNPPADRHHPVGRHDPAPTDEWAPAYPAPAGYDPGHGYSTTQLDGPEPGHVPTGGPAQPARDVDHRRELRPAHHGGPAPVNPIDQPYDRSAAPPPRHQRSDP